MRSPDETEEFLRYYIAEISKGVDWANVNYFTPGYHMANDQLKGWHFGKYMGMLQARFLSEGNGRTWAEFVDQHLKSEEMSKTFGNMFDGERWSQYWKSFGSS
jgi:fido (protein-threonine AMPylation protein)